MSVASRMTIDEARPLGAVRACAYLRVSTGRQAESDLSIPDQRKQVANFCQAKGWPLLAEYIEPGASATDDARPEFQRMIERATDGDRPFDVVVVHSYSRFFRDSFGLEMYIRRLAKVGVRLVSITQELGDDPAQVMMRQVIALFDEYQSRENAKHVLRAMKENARQGFYNGSPVPLGYRTEEVEKRGARIKKQLTIDPVEAETVQMIFRLYRHGDGRTGPLGVKEITKRLNAAGHRTRRNAHFGVGTLHGILTNTVYVGEWVFNRRESKTLRQKPAAEHIIIAVPPIIERADFEAVQATLKARNPRAEAPRVVTGPILLTGLAVCASCEGGMTLRTGTSKNGKVHRYYTCSACARSGKTACKGRSIRMDMLDDLVVDHLSEHLFTTERLTELLASIASGRAEKAAEVDGRIIALQREASDAEDKLKRLYRMVEDGIAEMDDILKERVASLRLDRERAQGALDRIRAQMVPSQTIPPEVVERFGRAMRDNIRTGEVPFRKAYLRSVIDRVEVDDDAIRILGDTATLEQVIAGQTNASTGGAAEGATSVRRSVRKWRARKDSNL
ncbi:recombinase family protein [Aureimonas ureilytica]|uniref:recombinase family protein n=1 Tax=Aureimonas ureilytica TaxID=401562 RepID=UPI0009EC8A81|nr:recombinase family protein [Aureimonas ureilytica]